MSQPFVGEVRMFAGNFAPPGWAICNGQLMSISDSDTLFNLIGTMYGGDGESTFALPDLRSRVPMHQGNNHNLGEQGGAEQVALAMQQMANHTHLPGCDASGASSPSPAGNVWGTQQTAPAFSGPGTEDVNMNAGTMSPVGGGQPHDNMLPYVAINFIISLFGNYPMP